MQGSDLPKCRRFRHALLYSLAWSAEAVSRFQENRRLKGEIPACLKFCYFLKTYTPLSILAHLVSSQAFVTFPQFNLIYLEVSQLTISSPYEMSILYAPPDSHKSDVCAISGTAAARRNPSHLHNYSDLHPQMA